MSHLVTVTKHFLVTLTFRDITLYVVNNHRIARTIGNKLKQTKKG
jgi:hypothetical protein